MGTIQNQKIGLRIAGTKSRQGGFAPLVAVGILAGNEDDNMDKITVVSEKPVYAIKHTNNYILYQLIDRKVKPCDNNTPGILSIALTIARDVQLAYGKSPYSLLKEVYNKFISDYMERGSDGLDRFIDKNTDQSEFVSILEQYPLENRSSAYIPMNPGGMSGTICIPQDKMTELFRDSQYQEFAPYKDIEIGVNCMTMPDLENIEIPRPQTYFVVVNDAETKTTMKKSTDFFDTATILRDTQDVTYDNIYFSLDELLDSPNYRIDKGKSSVVLDAAHNRIVCNVYKEQITYTLEYFIEGDTEKARQNLADKILTNQIKLTMGTNVVKFPSSSPKKTVIPVSYIKQKVGITPNYTDIHTFSAKSNVDDIKRSINVTIAITPLRTGGAIITQRSNNYSGNTENRSLPGRTEQRSNETIQTSANPDIGTGIKNPSNKKKSYNVKLIFLIVGIVLGMSIGFGTWGFHSYASKSTETITDIKLTDGDSANIYKAIKEKIEAGQQGNSKEVEHSDTVANTKDVAKKKADTDTIEKKARTDILELVNAKELQKCRDHTGWKNYLTTNEKYAVEAVLADYKQVQKKALKNVLKDRYNSWEELKATRKSIIKTISPE